MDRYDQNMGVIRNTWAGGDSRREAYRLVREAIGRQEITDVPSRLANIESEMNRIRSQIGRDHTVPTQVENNLWRLQDDWRDHGYRQDPYNSPSSPRRRLPPLEPGTTPGLPSHPNSGHNDLLEARNGRYARYQFEGEKYDRAQRLERARQAVPNYDELVGRLHILTNTRDAVVRARDAAATMPGGKVYEPHLLVPTRLPLAGERPFDLMNTSYEQWVNRGARYSSGALTDFERSLSNVIKAAEEMVKEHLGRGGRLDDRFFEQAGRRLIERLRELPSLPVNSSLANGVLRSVAEEIQGNIAGRLGHPALQALSRAAQRAGRSAPVVLGGIATAGAFVAAEGILGASNTGCGTLGSQYMNLDANNRCQPVHQVDARVMSFLRLDPSEQIRVLREQPQICDYYKQMHERFFAQPSFEGLECRGTSGYVLKTRDRGEAIEYDVSLRGDGSTRDIRVRRNGSGHLHFPFANQTDDVYPGTLRAQTNVEYLQRMRLFIPDASDCCRQNGTQGETCARGFLPTRSVRPGTPPSPTGQTPRTTR